MTNKKIQVIDVKSIEEFEKLQIPGAVTISPITLEKQRKSLDKHTRYITACGKGGRSSDVSKIFNQRGYNAF